MTEYEFEKFLEELQRKIEYEEEQTYSKVVIDEYRRPSNFGDMKNPDVVSELKGNCGDTMRISFRIDNKKIKQAMFWTDGCGATIACGSMLTKMITGRTIDEIEIITEEQLTKELDGLPEEHMHCSKLAVNTLKKVLGKLKLD